jgi:cell division protein FtsB
MALVSSENLFKRLIASPLILIFLVVIIILSISATWNIFKKERTTRESAEMAQNEVEQLKERKAFLELKMADLETTEGQERALREQFGIAEPDEQVLILVDDPNATVGENTLDESFWVKIRGFFDR